MTLERDFLPEKRDWVADHLATIEASGTTESITATGGAPIVVFTIKGAKTGKLRKIPLIRIEHAGEYGIISTNGGSPHDPAWVHSLRVNPRVEVQDGANIYKGLAHETFDEEYRIWWERGITAFPPIIEYAEKTERYIPVFVVKIEQ